MKINDVKGIPAELLKKKKLSLYKAFIFCRPGMEMNVNTGIDMLAITPEAAVRQLLSKIPVTVFQEEMDTALDAAMNRDEFSEFMVDQMTITHKEDKITKISLKNAVVSFAIFNMDVEDLKTKQLVNGSDDEDYFQDDILAITLADKLYKLDVSEKRLVSFKLSINPVNEERKFSGIELKEIK